MLGRLLQGDLYVGFLGMDWWGLLDRAASLTRAEVKAGWFKPANLEIPDLALSQLLESSGASPREGTCALALSGLDPEKARALLREARVVPTPWESVVAPCYSLRLGRSRSTQKPADRSFLGGLPSLCRRPAAAGLPALLPAADVLLPGRAAA
ncbi:MAG: hypothetical protein HY319_23295 [Armatimonadetes bacterium]|nr:hypothetical protein [Armatimonadota bacterium]